MNKNISVQTRLPKIEKTVKIKVGFNSILLSFKYTINATPDDIKIINVEVSIASFIGKNNIIVIIGTKNTPPPTPAILLIVPTRNPSRINKIIIFQNKSIKL